MVRPSAKELTERELEVMHIFWQHDELTANTARDLLAESGNDLAYVTVANLVRVLVEKGFLETKNDTRPFLYAPVRTFEEVSRSFVGNLLQSVFLGSREQLLLQLFGKRKKLTKRERELLQQILEDQD